MSRRSETDLGRVLVTGGAGFVGSHIVDLLDGQGVETVVVDDLSSGSRSNLPATMPLIERDVADPRVVADIRSVAPHVIIHAAGQVSVAASVTDAAHDRSVNLVGTEHVIRGAISANARRLVFLSSGGAVYGDQRLATEATLPSPASPYGIHKLAAEGYVRTSGIAYGIARFSNIYGPRQRNDLEGGVIAIFIDRLLAGEAVTIYGSGTQTRDFVHVSDAAAATVMMAMAHQSGTWNVSTGSSVSIIDLLGRLEELIGPAVRIERKESRPGDVAVSTLSNRQIRQDLDWQPSVELGDGLTRTIAWAQD